MNHQNQIVAAVLASVRGELSVSYVADMCGVTELQVQGWKDLFLVAGVLAVANALKSDAGASDFPSLDRGSHPTTTQLP